MKQLQFLLNVNMSVLCLRHIDQSLHFPCPIPCLRVRALVWTTVNDFGTKLSVVEPASVCLVPLFHQNYLVSTSFFFFFNAGQPSKNRPLTPFPLSAGKAACLWISSFSLFIVKKGCALHCVETSLWCLRQMPFNFNIDYDWWQMQMYRKLFWMSHFAKVGSGRKHSIQCAKLVSLTACIKCLFSNHLYVRVEVI